MRQAHTTTHRNINCCYGVRWGIKLGLRFVPGRSRDIQMRGRELARLNSKPDSIIKLSAIDLECRVTEETADHILITRPIHQEPNGAGLTISDNKT